MGMKKTTRLLQILNTIHDLTSGIFCFHVWIPIHLHGIFTFLQHFTTWKQFYIFKYLSKLYYISLYIRAIYVFFFSVFVWTKLLLKIHQIHLSSYASYTFSKIQIIMRNQSTMSLRFMRSFKGGVTVEIFPNLLFPSK